MDVMTPEYSFEFPRHQHFSLRFNLICYIIENPSTSEVLLKLQQTCKYFFAKNKVIVVPFKIFYDFDKVCFVDSKEEKVSIPLGKIKYWFNSTGSLNGYWKPFCLFITPHVYRITLKKLSMTYDSLSLNDLNMLLSNKKMEEIYMYMVDIRDPDGNVVPVEYVLSRVPHIREFRFCNQYEIYSNDAMKKLNNVKLFNKLNCFSLGFEEIPEGLDPEILYEFIRRNAAPDAVIKYWLTSNSRPFSESFKIQLTHLVNVLLPDLDLKFNL